MSGLWASGPSRAKLVFVLVFALGTVTASIPFPGTDDGRPAAPLTGEKPFRAGSMGGEDFTMDGTLDRALAPNITATVEISLTNPNPYPLAVSELSVEVHIIRKKAGIKGRCVAGDFAIRQFSGPLGFVLGAARTTSLTDLGFSPAQLPKVTMVNLPHVNQDGCKGASIDFKLSGTAEETS